MRHTQTNDSSTGKKYFFRPEQKNFNKSRVKEPKPFDLGRELIGILRHNAIKEGLPISSNGYVLCDDILNLNQFSKFTIDDIKNIVDTNDKQRFALKEENSKFYIMAKYGHSGVVKSVIDQDKMLIKLTDPLLIVFGTTLEIYHKEIKINGLKNPKTGYVYFEIYDKNETSFKEKFRYLVHVNMQLAMDDDIEFYITQNNVVLSNGCKNGIIDKKYIIQVTDRATGEIVV